MASNRNRIPLLCAVLALCVFAWPASTRAQDGAQHSDDKIDEEVYEVGNGVTSPRVTHQVDPEHPTHGFRISGSVLIGLVVSSNGDPKNVHVVRSLEKEVDQSAVDAVKKFRFDPARKEGKPVAVKVVLEIRFHDM